MACVVPYLLRSFQFTCTWIAQESSAPCWSQVHPAPSSSVDATLALTPPMGWNSWDGYGTTINEAQVRANAQWMAQHLKAFGWQYVTVDMQWFAANPTAEGNSKKILQYSLDRACGYTPAVNRFPLAANGAGFKPLADYIHLLGFKFGIHSTPWPFPSRRWRTNFRLPIRPTRPPTRRIRPTTCPGISITLGRPRHRLNRTGG